MGTLRDAWKHWYRRTAVGIAPRLYWRTRHRQRGFEEPELRLLPQLCRAGSTAIDVGGNFGMHTYWLAGIAGRCVVFEPVPALARALARGFGKAVEVHNVALSNEAGTAELIIPRISPGLSTLEPRNALSPRALQGATRIHVRKQRLDELALTDVSFMKVDVEGHEEAVLLGAQQLLHSQRPTLLVELEERHNPGCIERVKALLGHHGLRGVVIHGGQLVSLDAFDAVAHQKSVPESEYVRNFIFARPEILATLRC